MAENETSLLNQLHQRRESVMGVSVDEEISALIKFQNGYQANARVMSTLVSMLDTLISMAR
jgi:flagellar hook-associated protein 1 FlgK